MNKLYNDEVEILKIHPYRILDKGHKISPPGVTTIVGQFSKDGLYQWVANETAKTAIELKGTLPDNEVYDIARKRYIELRDSAGNEGTKAHEWIELYTKGEIKKSELPDEELTRKLVKAYLQFEKDYKLEDHNPETPLYSRVLRYAGIRDNYLLINGVRYTLDYKTGNPDFEYNAYQRQYTGNARAYDTHFMQCAGYDIASEECLGQDSEGYAILYLIKDPFALSKKYGIPVKKYFFFTTEDTDYWKDRFICALDYWYYSHEGKNKYKEVR